MTITLFDIWKVEGTQEEVEKTLVALQRELLSIAFERTDKQNEGKKINKDLFEAMFKGEA